MDEPVAYGPVGRRGRLHHLELWLDGATSVEGPLPWLLLRLGYTLTSTWATGTTWTDPGGDAYLVVESGPDHRGGPQDRRRSGLNHLALWAGTRDDVDTLAAEAVLHGWALMFPDRHPFAGGPDHYAAYLENTDGLEVELVADP